MRIFLIITVILAVTVPRQPVHAKAPKFKKAKTTQSIKKLAKKIQGVLSLKRNRHLQAGVVIASMDRNEILFELNPDQLLIPASVNKVFTAYAILKKLGPNSRFKTQLFATEKPKEGKLIGNLYLKGGGDPSLVSERLWMLVNDFMRQGIREVRGNLIGDDSYFDKNRTPNTRPRYLKDQAYNAPVGALSFNFNTTTIYVRPNEKIGQPPHYYIDPENSYVDVVNQAKTTRGRSKFKLRVSRTEHVQGDLGDTLLLRGSIPVGHKEVRYYRNIVNPTRYSLHMLKTFLERRGVVITGTIQESRIPKNARLLLAFDSLPMWHIVGGMNKFSNNFVADQLLKKMGAEIWGVPGNLKKGLTSLGDALEDIGIARNAYEIQDGSGLTRKTRITARQVVHVLTAGHKDFSIASEFGASLGVAGQDGTLKSRFPKSARALIRAKTGTLNEVAALAGFTTSQDGETLAFAVLLNDPKRKYGYMAGWTDKIALAARGFRR